MCPRSASNTPWSLNQSCVERRRQFSCSFLSDVRFLGPPLKKIIHQLKMEIEKKCRCPFMPFNFAARLVLFEGMQKLSLLAKLKHSTTLNQSSYILIRPQQ